MTLKTILLSLFAAVFLFSCGTKGNQSSQTDAGVPGKAHLDIAERVDMGDFYEPRYKKYVTVPFRNTGTDTLHIAVVEPECECTEIVLKDTVLAPGASGTLDAYLDLLDYPSIQVEKPFFIISDADNRIVYVSLVGIRH